MKSYCFITVTVIFHSVKPHAIINVTTLVVLKDIGNVGSLHLSLLARGDLMVPGAAVQMGRPREHLFLYCPLKHLQETM